LRFDWTGRSFVGGERRLPLVAGSQINRFANRNMLRAHGDAHPDDSSEDPDAGRHSRFECRSA
jgi:hypothetical protein